MAFSVLNILFSSYFVLSLNLNVFGAALGTMIASYTTALIFIIIIHKHIKNKFQIIPKFEKVFNPSKVIRLLKINFDIFIRTLFLTFSFLWITYQSSKLGEDFVAVNAILMQFVILSAFFLDAYAFTAEGMVGYTLGKRNKKSFLQVVKNTIQISFFTSVIISIFFLIFFKEMINILTDIELLRFISYSYILWIVIIIPTSSFCYQLDGIFIGSSQTKDLRNAMMISVTVFIVISFYFVKYFDNHGLWLSLFLFMILRSLTLKYFFNNILRKF